MYKNGKNEVFKVCTFNIKDNVQDEDITQQLTKNGYIFTNVIIS